MKHRVRKGDVTCAKTMINWVVCGRSLMMEETRQL